MKKLLLAIILLFICRSAFAGGICAESGTLTQPTSTGNQTVTLATATSCTFNMIVFFGNQRTAAGSGTGYTSSIGFATGASNQEASSQQGDYNVATSATRCGTISTRVIQIINSAGTTLADADLVSISAGSFVINWDTADSTQRLFHWAGVGGVSATANHWTTAAGTGDNTVSGLGFQPSFLFMMGTGAATTPSTRTSAAMVMGWASSSSNQMTTDWHQSNAANPSISGVTQLTTKNFTARTNIATLHEGTLTSFGSGQFVENWSTASVRVNAYLALNGTNVKLGSANQATSTGNQSVTGFGFKPVITFFFSACHAAGAAYQNGNAFSVGVAVSSGDQRSISGVDTNNVTPTVNNTYSSSTVALQCATAGASPTLNSAATFVSNDADGITWNNTTADATSREIIYWSMGGGSVGGLSLLGVGSD